MKSRKHMLYTAMVNGKITYKQYWESLKAINDNRNTEWMPRTQDHGEAINFDLGM